MSKERKNLRVSHHFSTKEFRCNCGVCEGELRVSLGIIGGLELLRANSHKRIDIKAGFLCHESCEKYISKEKKLHNQGVAADITVKEMSLKALFIEAEKIPEFRGIGLNLTEKHIHVDTRKSDERELWVVEFGKKTPLDESNRNHYLEE